MPKYRVLATILHDAEAEIEADDMDAAHELAYSLLPADFVIVNRDVEIVEVSGPG